MAKPVPANNSTASDVQKLAPRFAPYVSFQRRLMFWIVVAPGVPTPIDLRWLVFRRTRTLSG